MTDSSIVQLDDEIISEKLLMVYRLLIEKPELNKRQACEELGLSYRTVLRWIRDGHLATHLANVHDQNSDISQLSALQELPSIVAYQAQIARGEVTVRGSNPTAAAQFVLQVASLGARSEESGGRPTMQQVNIYVPKVDKDKKAGTPVIDVPAKDVTPD